MLGLEVNPRSPLDPIKPLHLMNRMSSGISGIVWVFVFFSGGGGGGCYWELSFGILGLGGFRGRRACSLHALRSLHSARNLDAVLVAWVQILS